MNDSMPAPNHSDLAERLEQLLGIGVALSRERDINKLLEIILLAAKDVTNADGGTLYRMSDDKVLKFAIVRNDTLGIAMGGTTGVEIPFYPIQLFLEGGEKNTKMVAAHAVHSGRSVNRAYPVVSQTHYR